MRLWQATWNPAGHFLIWGEYLPSHPYALKPKLNPEDTDFFKTTEQDFAAQHPYTCSIEQLYQDLQALDIQVLEEDRINLFLPTIDDSPQLSPRLDPKITAPENCTLKVWSVPAVRISALEAINFLTAIPGELPEGLWFDDSFSFWREVSKLLLELLCRGRFLPSLKPSSENWRSSWKLLPLEKEDERRFQLLVEGMPGICSSLREENVDKKLEVDAFLFSFLQTGADALIRRFLQRYSFLDGLNQAKLVGKFGLQLEWLSSLNSETGIIRGQELALARQGQLLDSWAQRLLPQQKKQPVSIAFKLISPAPNLAAISAADPIATQTENRAWVVELLIEIDKQDRLFPAHSLWQGDPELLRLLNGDRQSTEESLLADLGKAVKVFPALRQALEDSHPTHVVLSTPEAYQFLRESSKILEEHNFKVILPAWWQQASTALGFHLHVASPEFSSNDHHPLSLSSLFSCSWQIVLGNKKLSLDEFNKLATETSPLVEIDNTWVELRPERVAAAMAFLEASKSNSNLPLVEVLRFGYGLQNQAELPPVVEFSASGWIEQLLDSTRHTLKILEAPDNFTGELRPYQKEGLSWLAFLAQVGVGACLADDMGLGKTVQLLALLSHEHQSSDTKGAPTLLIVPMSTLDNWSQEIKRFSPDLTTYMHHGTLRLSGSNFLNTARSVDIVLTTYSIAFRDEKILSEINWRRIALDEAQNIKNAETKQTKAIKRLSRSSLVATQSCHRLALTGTPLENHLDELWSIFDFLNPGFLGTSSEFRSQFVAPIERDRNELASQALANLIRPFLLRRVKTDPKVISDLPEKIEIEERTGLTEEQAELYRSVLDNMLSHVDSANGIRRKGLVLAMITKLKQICNHPALFLRDRLPLSGRSSKLTRLEEILEVILAEGDRTLLFTQYAQMGALLQPYLQERFNQEVLFLHGALSKNARDKVLQKFREPTGPKIFVLSLKAGGLGLNLTEANQVIHYDQWWNPAVQEQATDRAFRIGQKRNVQVRTFVCTGTLEERIQEMLSQKRGLADRIVEATRNVVTQMSTDELKRLLQFTGKEQVD